MISNIIPFMIFILFFFVLSFMDTFSIKVNDNIKNNYFFFLYAYLLYLLVVDGVLMKWDMI